MASVSPGKLLRGSIALVVVALLLATVGLTLAYEPPELGAGAIEEAADSETAVAIQGFHVNGEGDPKKPARLLSVNETGDITELWNGSEDGANWFYDVDPLDNGNLLVVTTHPPEEGPPGGTIVYEFDPEAEEVVWEQPIEAEDTHDVDKLDDHEIVVANMRNNAEDGTSDDRLFVYNRTTDEVVWEWHFRDHYPESTDGGMDDDWTHVNGVDPVGDEHFLVSPRNFDQVILVNRTSGDIDMRLGSDGAYDVMYEQHNPDYVEGPDGRPTIVVADSENDRVVEFARDCGDDDYRLEAGTPPEDCEWDLVWEVGGDRLNWPRDADRLPNGNTLVTDTLNHRVVEVTPDGEIVWEAFAPWGPYDAERVEHGPGSNGPTMAELGVEGSYELSYAGGTGASSDDTAADGTTPGGAEVVHDGETTTRIDETAPFPKWLRGATEGLPFAGPVHAFADTWQGASQWIKPVWMAPWGFVALVAALTLSLLWVVAEAVYRRRRIYGRLSSLGSRATSRIRN